jgi:nucleotide-binding universal stress UspA family protein
MTYATIVLHLDQGRHLLDSADLAIHLARQVGGHLTGLAASDRTLFSLTVQTGLTVNPELAGAIEATRLRAQARAQRFLDRAVVDRFHDVDAAVEETDDVQALIRRSRCCDLMILTRPGVDVGGEAYAHAWTRRQMEDVLLQGVAPTLVLPPGQSTLDLEGHALIGWNGSPEAARAVAGALPLLRRARRVTLLQCDSAFDVRRRDSLPDIELPRIWLARHGVKVDAWVEATADEPGESLLAQGARVGADFIVMGAWGHWRWSERLLGGATQSVLGKSTVPVLMCH